MVYCLLSHAAQDNCLQTNSNNGLPLFQGYTGLAGAPDRRIHHQNQAIIPSYKFNCCGNITAWGVDLNPDTKRGTFDFIFQVWRPSPSVNITGCYSLVDNFLSSSITITEIESVARVFPSPQDQLQFEPGDVLGFYVEAHGGSSDADNGVVLLSNGSHTSELVWFASVDITTVQPSQSGSCPYPVGINGVLSSSTHAAPVISVSVMTTPCSHIDSTVTMSSLTLPTYSTSTNSLTNSTTSTNLIPTDTYSITDYDFNAPSVSSSTTLVVWISIAVSLIVVLLTVIVAITTSMWYCKHHGKVSQLENDENRRELQTEDTYDYPNVDIVPSIELKGNQAYNSIATQGYDRISIKLEGNQAYAMLNSTLDIKTNIELQGNQAYRKLNSTQDRRSIELQDNLAYGMLNSTRGTTSPSTEN